MSDLPYSVFLTTNEGTAEDFKLRNQIQNERVRHPVNIEMIASGLTTDSKIALNGLSLTAPTSDMNFYVIDDDGTTSQSGFTDANEINTFLQSVNANNIGKICAVVANGDVKDYMNESTLELLRSELKLSIPSTVGVSRNIPGAGNILMGAGLPEIISPNNSISSFLPEDLSVRLNCIMPEQSDPFPKLEFGLQGKIPGNNASLSFEGYIIASYSPQPNEVELQVIFNYLDFTSIGIVAYKIERFTIDIKETRQLDCVVTCSASDVQFYINGVLKSQSAIDWERTYECDGGGVDYYMNVGNTESNFYNYQSAMYTSKITPEQVNQMHIDPSYHPHPPVTSVKFYDLAPGSQPPYIAEGSNDYTLSNGTVTIQEAPVPPPSIDVPFKYFTSLTKLQTIYKPAELIKQSYGPDGEQFMAAIETNILESSGDAFTWGATGVPKSIITRFSLPSKAEGLLGDFINLNINVGGGMLDNAMYMDATNLSFASSDYSASGFKLMPDPDLVLDKPLLLREDDYPSYVGENAGIVSGAGDPYSIYFNTNVTDTNTNQYFMGYGFDKPGIFLGATSDDFRIIWQSDSIAKLENVNGSENKWIDVYSTYSNGKVTNKFDNKTKQQNISKPAMDSSDIQWGTVENRPERQVQGQMRNLRYYNRDITINDESKETFSIWTKFRITDLNPDGNTSFYLLDLQMNDAAGQSGSRILVRIEDLGTNNYVLYFNLSPDAYAFNSGKELSLFTTNIYSTISDGEPHGLGISFNCFNNTVQILLDGVALENTLSPGNRTYHGGLTLRKSEYRIENPTTEKLYIYESQIYNRYLTNEDYIDLFPGGALATPGTPSINGFPGLGTRNDYDGNVGHSFTMKKSVFVTKLGRIPTDDGIGLRQSKSVKVWDNDSQTLIAEVEVGPFAHYSSTLSALYYEDVEPFQLKVGRSYTITQKCTIDMSDRWFNGGDKSNFNDDLIYNVQGTFSSAFNPDGFPTNIDGEGKTWSIVGFISEQAPDDQTVAMNAWYAGDSNGFTGQKGIQINCLKDTYITKLGVGLPGNDELLNPTTLSLFRIGDKKLLSSVTITRNAPHRSNNFVYNDIVPIKAEAGQSYTIVRTMTSGQPDKWYKNGEPNYNDFAFADYFTVGYGRFTNNVNPGVFPNSIETTKPVGRYMGAVTFIYDDTPDEPNDSSSSVDCLLMEINSAGSFEYLDTTGQMSVVASGPVNPPTGEIPAFAYLSIGNTPNLLQFRIPNAALDGYLLYNADPAPDFRNMVGPILLVITLDPSDPDQPFQWGWLDEGSNSRSFIQRINYSYQAYAAQYYDGPWEVTKLQLANILLPTTESRFPVYFHNFALTNTNAFDDPTVSYNLEIQNSIPGSTVVPISNTSMVVSNREDVPLVAKQNANIFSDAFGTLKLPLSTGVANNVAKLSLNVEAKSLVEFPCFIAANAEGLADGRLRNGYPRIFINNDRSVVTDFSRPMSDGDSIVYANIGENVPLGSARTGGGPSEDGFTVRALVRFSQDLGGYTQGTITMRANTNPVGNAYDMFELNLTPTDNRVVLISANDTQTRVASWRADSVPIYHDQKHMVTVKWQYLEPPTLIFDGTEYAMYEQGGGTDYLRAYPKYTGQTWQMSVSVPPTASGGRFGVSEIAMGTGLVQPDVDIPKKDIYRFSLIPSGESPSPEPPPVVPLVCNGCRFEAASTTYKVRFSKDEFYSPAEFAEEFEGDVFDPNGNKLNVSFEVASVDPFRLLVKTNNLFVPFRLVLTQDDVVISPMSIQTLTSTYPNLVQLGERKADFRPLGNLELKGGGTLDVDFKFTSEPALGSGYLQVFNISNIPSGDGGFFIAIVDRPDRRFLMGYSAFVKTAEFSEILNKDCHLSMSFTRIDDIIATTSELTVDGVSLLTLDQNLPALDLTSKVSYGLNPLITGTFSNLVVTGNEVEVSDLFQSFNRDGANNGTVGYQPTDVFGPFPPPFKSFYNGFEGTLPISRSFVGFSGQITSDPGAIVDNVKTNITIEQFGVGLDTRYTMFIDGTPAGTLTVPGASERPSLTQLSFVSPPDAIDSNTNFDAFKKNVVYVSDGSFVPPTPTGGITGQTQNLDHNLSNTKKVLNVKDLKFDDLTKAAITRGIPNNLPTNGWDFVTDGPYYFATDLDMPATYTCAFVIVSKDGIWSTSLDIINIPEVMTVKIEHEKLEVRVHGDLLYTTIALDIAEWDNSNKLVVANVNNISFKLNVFDRTGGTTPIDNGTILWPHCRPKVSVNAILGADSPTINLKYFVFFRNSNILPNNANAPPDISDLYSFLSTDGRLVTYNTEPQVFYLVCTSSNPSNYHNKKDERTLQPSNYIARLVPPYYRIPLLDSFVETTDNPEISFKIVMEDGTDISEAYQVGANYSLTVQII